MTASPATPDASRRSACVMIVDDEPDNLDVLQAALARLDCRFSVFRSGRSALDYAREQPPAVLLLDVRMPDMDGFEVCRAFKADERLRDVPVLFLSALDTPEAIVEGFRCGAADYITKPFREAEVVARVEVHLALRTAYDDLEKSHRELKHQEALREQLVNMIVHDMRGPLQMILGHLEMLDLAATDRPREEMEDIQCALAGVRILAGMADDMLDVSRSRHTALAVTAEPASVEQIVARTIIGYVPPDMRCRLDVTVRPRSLAAHCDVGLTVRILANLIRNALKYSGPTAAVSADARLDGGNVRVDIHDQGPGIDPAHLARAFEPFVTGQPAGATGERSFGLGLAFCKLAVEAQGGSITVASEVGTGSTFSVALPIARAQPANPSANSIGKCASM